MRPGMPHHPQLGPGRVLDRRHRRRPPPRAGPPPGHRRLVAQRLVRPHRVVHRPPAPRRSAAKCASRVAPRPRPELALQGPVEPLDLALRLGVVRPAVDRPDAQPDQPGVEGRQPHGRVAGARRRCRRAAPRAARRRRRGPRARPGRWRRSGRRRAAGPAGSGSGRRGPPAGRRGGGRPPAGP